MSAKLKIRKGDKVVVITGKDKGKQGEVVRTIPSENRAVVRGVNVAKRHQRQSISSRHGLALISMMVPVAAAPTRAIETAAPNGQLRDCRNRSTSA